jgi:delta 1-pyrroline-5-carboxylate dehydrogenase
VVRHADFVQENLVEVDLVKAIGSAKEGSQQPESPGAGEVTLPALNYIGGAWVESTSRERVRDVNPAHSSQSLGDATVSTPADVVHAIDAAAAAYQEWRRTPAPQRGDMVRKAADLMERRRVELARLLTEEEGKTLPESLGEVDRAVANVRFAAAQGSRLTGETIPSTQRGTFIYTVRDPIGVVACITPWNFPVAIPAWKIAPALVAGNAVVFKPATLTPLCAAQVVQCFIDGGVPDGVLNMVLGPGDALSRAIIDDERVKAISFTGSNAVGRRLYAQATWRRRPRASPVARSGRPGNAAPQPAAPSLCARASSISRSCSRRRRTRGARATVSRTACAWARSSTTHSSAKCASVSRRESARARASCAMAARRRSRT